MHAAFGDDRRSDRADDPSGAAPTTTGDPLKSLEVEPESAATIFGDRIELGRRFTRDLALHGELLGLIGPLELPRLWTRHVLNSAVLAPLILPGARVGDIGSGAGLPGLVLAIARPDAHFVLIEPMERRCEWLHAEADRLGLDNVTVLRARAEDAFSVAPLDQVTARAVSALRTLIPLAAPLVRRGGELIVLKGARVQDEVEAARKQIAKYRLSAIEVVELGRGLVPEATRVFRATVDAAS
ncbi:16S rRNA (guanine527-N7)-methyltransferase [Yonghaparkia alkaliphila]|uniref:Ribosomal RNA small subunit methyltransferase G n=1 Tax=Microcella alkalica TaxID=355930 RepID=A0A839EE70_9MICO|nr:16S rRNA (guanine527-N7)-methyltransferase [Microcella alkalica]